MRFAAAAAVTVRRLGDHISSRARRRSLGVHAIRNDCLTLLMTRATNTSSANFRRPSGPGLGPGRAESCDAPPTKFKLAEARPGGRGRRRACRPRPRPMPTHPAGAIGSGSLTAQHGRLPNVGHHVLKEGTARAEASDGAALTAVVGPP